MATPPAPTLLHGEAVGALRQSVSDAAVDMVYLDPPFGTQQDWHGAAGSFSDRHEWDDEAREAEAEFSDQPGWPVLMAIAAPLPLPDRAYLVKMVRLLAELRRVMRPTASLWLHCDDTMGHYLRCALDLTFANPLGVVIWKRSTAKSNSNSFGRVHDTIHVAARSRATRWRLARCRAALGPRCARPRNAAAAALRHDPKGAGETWDFEDGSFLIGDPCEEVFVDGYAEDRLTGTAKERVGWPTQKPVALLERLIRGATLAGDLVLDPTCGSGTTLVAAMKLGRRAIGIDRSIDAIATARKRIGDAEPRQLGLFGSDAPDARRAFA